MTPGAGFTAGGTSVDRAGGLLRLRSIADELVGKVWIIRTLDTGSYWRLVLDAYPAGTDPDDIEAGVASGRVEIEIRAVQISRSASIRIDQSSLLADDERDLEILLRSEVERRTLERLPESEKRLLDGNR